VIEEHCSKPQEVHFESLDSVDSVRGSERLDPLQKLNRRLRHLSEGSRINKVSAKKTDSHRFVLGIQSAGLCIFEVVHNAQSRGR